MPLVATGAEQSVWLLWRGNMTQSHGWNLLATNGALIVIPKLGLKSESLGVKISAIIKEQNTVSALGLKPDTLAATLAHLFHDGLWRWSIRNKRRKSITQRDAARHPLISW